ncbi:MAG: hypothetical protein R3C11_17590 [Planctomycetaceae bacterium]
MTITPPSYTQLEESQHDGALGEIPVPEQSSVELQITSSQKLVSGEIRFQSDDPSSDLKSIPLQIASDQNSAEALLPSTQSGRFTIHFVDEHQFEFIDQVHRHLKIIPDRPPEIEPTQITRKPESNTEPLYQLPLFVRDDYSVALAEMIVKHPDEPARILNPARQESKTIQETSFLFEFTLSKSDLERASEVMVHFRATDNRPLPRPNETWTEPVALAELLDPSLIEDPAALEAALDAALQKELEDLHQALQKQETDVDKLAIKARLDQPLEGADRRSPSELIQEEQELSLQLESIAEKFADHALYQELAPIAQHIARHEIPPAEGHLREVQELKSASPKESLPALSAASQQLKTASQQVEQLQEWLNDLIRLKEEVPELSELSKRAQNLAEQLADQPDSNDLEGPLSESEALDQSMEDFLTRHPELAQAAEASLLQELLRLAAQIQTSANQQAGLNESVVADLGQQQAELNQLNETVEQLTSEQEASLQQELATSSSRPCSNNRAAATLALQTSAKIRL